MSEQSSNVLNTEGETSTNGESSRENDLLASLVGDGKKYKSVTDLAKSRLEADKFIETLKTENKALREALDDSNDAIEEKVRALANRSESTGTRSSESNQSRSESLTEDDLFNLFNKWETSKKVQDNRNVFVNRAREAFGDKADDVISERLSKLGMDQDLYTAMIERNPESALKLLGAERSAASGGAGQRESSVNTAAYLTGGVEKENHSYFQKLRREMGYDFYKPEVQSRMIQARKKLGDDYWK